MVLTGIMQKDILVNKHKYKKNNLALFPFFFFLFSPNWSSVFSGLLRFLLKLSQTCWERERLKMAWNNPKVSLNRENMALNTQPVRRQDTSCMLLCLYTGIAQRWSPRGQAGYPLSCLWQPQEGAQGELGSFPPRNAGGAAPIPLPGHAWGAAMPRQALLQCSVPALQGRSKTERWLLRASSCNPSAEAFIPLSLRAEARQRPNRSAGSDPAGEDARLLTPSKGAEPCQR